MSKHWRPPGGGRLTAGEIGLTLLGGVAAGLLFVSWPMPGGGEAAPVDEAWRKAPVPDRWAESKRSRDILATQEGSPGEDPRAAGMAEAATRAMPGGVRVIDGDTFRYGGETIRIADIDTPEVRGRCAHETRLAAQATARMASLLAAGPFELQPIGRDVDQYGRKLRVVTRNGRSLGDQLVSEGLARTWTGRRLPWCG